MAGPNLPPRPGQGAPRPGGARSRPTAKRRPPARPAAKKGGGWSPNGAGASAGEPDEVVLSPGAKRPPQQHLKMVPLNGRSEGTYDDGKDLGTGAFTRPVNHQPPAAAVGGPVGPPMGHQPMGGIQGPMAAGPMVAGPMAGAGVVAQGGMPYGQMPDESRTASGRVFMVILAFVLMVCGSILMVAMALLVAFVQNNQPEPLPPLASPVAAQPAVAMQLDTGDGKKAEDKPTKKKTTTKRRTGTGSSKKTTTSTKSKPPPEAPPPEPVGGPGTVTVTLPAGVRASSMEITCDGGSFRERSRFTGSKARMENVPAGSCNLFFVGIGSKKRFGFSGSHNFVCSGVGSNIVCK